MTLNLGTVALKYDAWGRVVSASSAQSAGGASLWVTHTYSYDALGRQISDTVSAGGASGGYGASAVAGTTHLLYNGQNVIEERNGLSLTSPVTTQYVWSAAGANTLILRDSQTTPASPGASSYIPQIGSALFNQRLYAQDNGQGSVTSITGVNGAVVERYLYDQDGKPTALQPNWSAWSSNPDGGNSQYGWVYLWHGGRNVQFFSDGTGATPVQDGGFYTFNAGSAWYDAPAGLADRLRAAKSVLTHSGHNRQF